MDEEKSFRHLVRIANTDLNGNIQISYALRRIKGVSYMFSNALCHAAQIQKDKKTGNLSDQEVKQLDAVLKSPSQYGLPIWLFNRRKDFITGNDMHLVTSDLIFSRENDIKMMRKVKSYKGIRHSLGLPVRGQRTRSNFRENKGKVHLGVKVSPQAKSGKV